MTIEQQVISLTLAKRLKELGVKQDESYFMWIEGKKLYVTERAWIGCRRCGAVLNGIKPPRTIPTYAAFTVAELGEMLPGTMGMKDEVYRVSIEWMQGLWRVSYQSTGEGQFLCEEFAAKEAEARGLMLAYLIENNLMSI